MKIAVVVGCRPEFIKMFPVVAELRRRGESPIVIGTGQHTDLLRGTPFEDGMAPDVNLGLAGSNDPFQYVEICEEALRMKWVDDEPQMVIVQGDTASAYAAASAAWQLGIPVAHVEAGVRSGDELDPWPEESFRIGIDQNATWLFCATKQNFQNLVDALEAFKAKGSGPLSDLENYPFALLHPSHTRTTGNPGIDALYSHTTPVEQSQKVDRVLITLHRRESFGEPLKQIVRGLIAGAGKYSDIDFRWPMHPNPRVQEVVSDELCRNLLISDALPTVAFAQMLATSRAVITDSGGVSEEAAALGVAAIIAREKTDRPESVELGLARVVGRSEEGVLRGLEWALDTKCEPSTCFGDGHAAPRIVQHLLG